NTIMEELKSNNVLWNKLLIFIYDLQKFDSNAPSVERLDRTTTSDYISEPYFSESEAKRIRDTVVDGESYMTLGQALQEDFQKRAQNKKETGDHGVCTSHHLLPVFEKAFRVRAKELGSNKVFVKMMKRVDKKGLEALRDG
ncbi:hypothetical protein EJ02DRAFT_308953, partial [Clathrospora elynae]